MARNAEGSTLRIVAIIPAYNEEDIIVPSFRHLIDQDINVYLIENWSTDATLELARQFLGKGLQAIERFPAAGPPRYYNLKQAIRRVEQLTREIDADWFIWQSVDEIRASPWPLLSLRDAIQEVDRAGFNCIDHTVVTFHPLDNDFVPGTDFEEYFKYFDFSDHPAHFREINCWKNLGKSISLADSGGHEVVFDGRRLFPYKFLLKHYPVRSQAHGEKKIFKERKARWDPEIKAQGAHIHYDHINQGYSFLRSHDELARFDQASFRSAHFRDELSIIDWAEAGRKWSQDRLVESLTSQLVQKDEVIRSLSVQIAELEREKQVLTERVQLREAELNRITSTLGWQMLQRYGKIKYPYLLPLYKLLRLMPNKPAKASDDPLK